MSDGDDQSDGVTTGPEVSDRFSANANVLVGAVLVGMATYRASWSLAVRASGNFPDGGVLGALFTLVVFAVGVVFLVDGAASVLTRKRSAE